MQTPGRGLRTDDGRTCGRAGHRESSSAKGIESGVCGACRIDANRRGKRSERIEYGHLPPDRATFGSPRSSRLPQASYHQLARVTGTLQDGVLILKGRVSSYYLKQIAQRIVLDRLEGRTTVVNNLEVES